MASSHDVLKVSRVVLMESNVESCIPPVELKTGTSSRQASSIVRVKYGDGLFLLSLAWITDESHTQATKDLLRETIARLTLETLVPN